MTKKEIAPATPFYAFEYMSVQRARVPGTPYESVADFLSGYGEAGWELVSVVWGSKHYIDEQFEVFYLKRPLA